MSETLRDLVVSLSLNSDNFTRNIKSIQRQIQEAESAFKLASAGVENFENTTAGLSAKLGTLQRTLTLQKEAVTQYERALAQASSKLQECYDRQNDYAQRLADAKTRQEQLKVEVQNAASAYNRYKTTLGETDSATIAAKGNLDLVKEEYRQQVAEVKKLEGQNVALKKSTQNAADAFSQAATKLNGAKAAYRETSSEIDKTRQALALSQTQWDAAGQTIVRSEQAIASIGKQLKTAESRFKLAAAGVKDFDKSAEGLSAKLTLLREKLVLQEKAVTQYETALAAAKDQLAAAQAVNDPEKIRQATDAVEDAQAALNNARAAVKQTKADIDETNKALKTAKSAWTAAGNSLTEFGKKCDKVSRTLGVVGRTLTTTVTTPIVSLGVAAVKASIDFESSFASVRKTVDATEAEFDTLAATSKRMSTEVAASTTEINEVMATGGQLGIATEHLEEFTKVMIDLGNSCEDLNADEAATSIAKFANVMGTDQGKFSNIGSTIVDLGNNFATTEKPIMEMAQRLAGAGKQVGLTEAQILGFAAALSSVGIEAQMGGSAFSKALVKMEVAAETGNDDLEAFAGICGVTAEQFKTMWASDPASMFMAFIEGLAQMDEEGESAIAVLNDIGISEVRLRDTLLRSVNATELFTRAQDMANAAWDENTALSMEANKRYATTASKLTNLKNKATLFAQTLGDDLNPTIHKLIEGASGLIDKLMGLDETQRMQIIKWAAIAAAIGPAFLALSKFTKGIGAVSGAVGKFATAVGKAGGGFSGFMKVVGSSPSIWVALATAVAVGTFALIDYASGAKAAREALEGMNETAKKWKDTAAETFYNQSKGLSFFGMSKDDFARETADAQGWIDHILALWSDGQKETDEQIQGEITSFKSLTSSVREELQGLKETADKNGYTSVSDGLATDISTLDSMDAEIESLLNKRKNKNFSDKDKIRLQELIDAREAIIVKYKLTPDDPESFETITDKVNAEVARAQARGKTDADVTVYENAVVAAAEGMAALNTAIDEQYNKEYAVIQLIEDSGERQQALDELNARYNEQRRNAALEYAKTLAGVIMPVWEQKDIQKAETDVQSLIDLMTQYSVSNDEERTSILQQMNDLSSGMDEGSLTEYVSLLTQIQSLMDSGLSEEEVSAMFPDIDFSTALDQIAAIQQFLSERPTELPGLETMFGEALPEEVLTIATDLDMTGARARWDEFAENPGAITTDAVIASYSAAETAVAQQPTVDAFIAKYTEHPDGADKSSLSPEGLIAYVSAYAEKMSENGAGADVSGLTPENITAMVSAYKELAAGADVSTLSPDEITAYIGSYLEKEGVDTTGLAPSGITAFVLAYEEATGGALTTALTPTDIAATVTRYMEAEDIDMTALTEPQLDAIITAFAEATDCDKTALKAEVVARITSYEEAEGVQRPSFIQTKISITGYDLTAYRRFIRENPLDVNATVRLSDMYENPTDALADTNAEFWENGVEVPASTVVEDQLRPDTVAILDSDGTMHILITPEITGTEEALENAESALKTTDHQGSIGARLFGDTTLDDVGRLNEYLVGINNEMNSWLNFGGWMNSWDRKAASSTLSNYLDMEEIGAIQTYIAEAVAAINSGETLDETTISNLQSLLELVKLLDAIGIGENVTAGIAEGMTEAGFDTDAETVAANLETAINTALDINSPSGRMMPVGEYVSAGIGQGASEYGFAADASAVASALESALRAAMPVSAFSGIGQNAMSGLKAGILSGRSGVIAAMRQAARDAVNAAKSELQINSPSRVFRDEVGAMTMKGLGEGVLKESRAQAKVIQNASRYLTGEAKAGSITTTSNDNRKTYNSTSTVSFAGSNFYVNDKPDIQSLAIEIARLTRRRQVGRGLV